MEIKNNVDSGYKAKLIDFNELQPINLKIPMYSDITKKSIISRGFVQPFAMCKIDDKLYIIDGHLRHDLINELINDGYKVPNEFSYYLIDVKNDFEIAIDTLMSFNVKVNPIDLPALNEWVKIKQISVNIEELNVKIEEVEEDNIKKNEDKNESDEEFFIPDCIYNSNNIYDIPTLKLENQATELILPLKPYGAEKRTNGGVGTYHFYVDDYRFEAIWKNPINILKSGCTQIVEPNLSLFDTTPISYGLFLIYKKRWLSRFLQEKGYNVYADLNVSQKFYDYNVLGIPEGYNSFFTRGYTGRLKYLEIELEIAQKISGKKEPNLVVYGGSKEIKDFCAKHNLTYIKDFINDK